MSINTMTTLAVARNRRQPTKADAGERTPDSTAATDSPSIPALLVKTVPTGLVTAYTAFVAVVSEASAKETDLIDLRWIAFVALVLAAIGVTIGSYKGKADADSRFPGLEVAAVTVAAAGWGLAMPESPLLAAIEDGTRGLVTIALVGFIALGVNSVLATLLKKQAS